MPKKKSMPPASAGAAGMPGSGFVPGKKGVNPFAAMGAAKKKGKKAPPPPPTAKKRPAK